jgi:hypothetical protein
LQGRAKFSNAIRKSKAIANEFHQETHYYESAQIALYKVIGGSK